MTWVYLDDKFHCNVKVYAVGNAGAGLFVRALSFCGDQLTDGFVPMGWAKAAAPVKLRDALTGAGLWRPVAAGDRFEVGELFVERDGWVTVVVGGDGYFIEDYLDHNPSKGEVDGRREKIQKVRSEAGKLGAQKRWADRDSKTSSKTIATSWQPDSNPIAPSALPSTPVRPKDTASLINMDWTALERRLGSERYYAFRQLFRSVRDPDNGTPGVIAAACKKLPAAYIEQVRVAYDGQQVPAGVVVNALKDQQKRYAKAIAA